MATTLVITCPQCQKQFKVPAEIQGKRMRCKACGQIFAVEAPAAAPPKPAPEPRAARAKAASASPASAPPKAPAESSLYGVVDFDMTPRCPHCAAEMPDDKAFICLQCGYNSLTRHKYEVTVAIATTGGERFLWLLPGIACAVGTLPFIGAICYLWLALPRDEDGQDGWLWAHIWGSVICLGIIWFLGKFAVRRLILNPNPPEKIKM